MQYEEFLENRKGGGHEGSTPVLELKLTLGVKVNMAFAERPTMKGGDSTQGRSD